MSNSYSGFRDQLLDQTAELRQVLYTIMDEKHLPITVHLKFNRFFDQRFIEHMKFGGYRLTVRRRRGDNAQIPGAHQAEVQRSRNRRGSQRKRVYVNPELLELFFYSNPKFLLLVNDQ